MIKRIHSVATVAILVLFAAKSIAFAQKVRGENVASRFPGAESENALLEQLRNGSIEAKALACKQLSIYGGKASVPELAKLLHDEQLSSWARIALEAIPDPSADAALIDAAGQLSSLPLVGVINSIGVKRSVDGIDVLSKRLGDDDEIVASAAAVALGNIGGERAIHALHQAFAGAKPALRSAICEGGILCAERIMAAGDHDHAAHIYEFIRTADVPQQRKLEATRGAILARGEDGIPLLVEQLKSDDEKRFALGLSTAREVKDSQKAVAAMFAQLDNIPPERAALIVAAIGDCSKDRMPPAILQVAKSGEKGVRLSAIAVVGRMGDASTIPILLETALETDSDLSQAAKTALAELAGESVNTELVARLPSAKGKMLSVLIEVLGQRRADTASELVKVLSHADDETRAVVLTALGSTAGPKELDLLIRQVIDARDGADGEIAKKALQAACIRMPDREATAAKLAAAWPQASSPARASLLEVLGAMGGPAALNTIAAAVKSGDEQSQDAGTRALGQWMTIDAAPVLLEIAKGSVPDKYRIRALRGYLRLARQQKMPDSERLVMCREALAAAQRDDERALVLDALKRCPSPESVEIASSLLSDKELRERAVETAIFIGEKIKETNPAAAKTAGERALKADPNGKLSDRARALSTSP